MFSVLRFFRGVTSSSSHSDLQGEELSIVHQIFIAVAFKTRLAAFDLSGNANNIGCVIGSESKGRAWIV